MTRWGRIVAAGVLPEPSGDTARLRRRGLTRAIGRGLGRVAAVFRSMLGQMLLATMLFVGYGIYSLAIVPFLSIPTLVRPDPMDATVSALNARLQAAMVVADDAGGALARARSDPLVDQVARRNPEFHYVFALGDKVAGTAPLYYYRRLHLDRFDRARARVEAPDLCGQLQRPVRDELGGGYIAYTNCGRLRYMEFRGVRNPVDIPLPTPFEIYSRWLWSYSRDFLTPALGIFLLLVAILLINVARIRRVARLTGDLGTDGPSGMLPEDGLPSEVIPLIRAVNHMTERVEETQRGRRFFLSAAAHELRTPLTVLRMRLEGMEEGELKAKLVRDLSRLTALSNNLLTLMGIEGRERRFEPVDLADACLTAMRGLRAIAAGSGVTLRFVDADAGSVVMGNAGLIEVAITNLIGNGISFAPVGTEVVIALDGARGFFVRDVGPGLPSECRDALFEPFVRGGTRRPGHGLGLAIVKAVADLHGATVWAEDATGGGARFAMIFPEVAPAVVKASLRTG